jgi:hypothetical protein
MYAPGAMSETDWKACRVLSRDKRNHWGDSSKVCREVVRTLDDALSSLGYQGLSPIVTAATQGEHAKGSYHYPTDERPGLAIDFMLPHCKRNELPDVFIHLLRFPFGGIGAYSEWSLAKGLPAIGGFHVDARPTGKKALWLKGRDGLYVAPRVATFLTNFL